MDAAGQPPPTDLIYHECRIVPPGGVDFVNHYEKNGSRLTVVSKKHIGSLAFEPAGYSEVSWVLTPFYAIEVALNS